MKGPVDTTPHTTAAGTAAPQRRRGFTLVEILVSILILALGVLGLGALFPAVIRQQRQSVEVISGNIAANGARAVLAGTDWSSGLDLKGSAAPPKNVWRYIREFTTQKGGMWVPFNPISPQNAVPVMHGQWWVPATVPFSGYLHLGATRAPNYVDVPTAARFYPDLGVGDPQYIWDIACQLDPTDPRNTVTVAGAVPQGRVRVALFVRRIDQGIRVPPGATLRAMLTSEGDPAIHRLPVGETRDGVPTHDGTDGAGGVRYSGVRVIGAAFRSDPLDGTAPARRDRLYLARGGANFAATVEALTQTGQKVIDNLGNIYSVTGLDDSDPQNPALIVEPPVPASVTLDQASGENITPAIFQIVFTPQPPAAVRLVEIEP